MEDDENTNEREEASQSPPIISYDESGNEEELFYSTKLINKELKEEG